MTTKAVPRVFFWRRVHSLTGFWLSLFLIEHLLTNSQAALWISDDGMGFIRAVNYLKNLPYLYVLEIVLLGIPILTHMAWGVLYLGTSHPDSWKTNGAKPYLNYKRNHAYTWQRITSWVLLFGIIAHVVQMRFYDYPACAQMGTQHYFMVRLDEDKRLIPLAASLGVQLYDKKQIQEKKEEFQKQDEAKKSGVEEILMKQKKEEQKHWLQAIEERPLGQDQVIAVAKNFGTAVLLMVRETFKWPVMIALYTIFVLAAVYHAYNGMWTFLITWGFTLTPESQVMMRKFTNFLMFLIGFFGLAAIWGTYLIN